MIRWTVGAAAAGVCVVHRVRTMSQTRIICNEPYPRRVARPHFPGKQRRMQLARAVLLQLAGRDKGEMMKVLKKTRQCTEAHVLVGPYQTKSMTPVPASILVNPCGNGMIAV